MDKVELHFVHGFLGGPSDWSEVLSYLPLEWSVTTHSLLNDLPLIKHKSDLLNGWAQLKESQWLSQSGKKRVVIGYSLGGRLALHLSPQNYDQLILVATHPGLTTEQEQRLVADRDWSEKLTSLEPHEFLQLWNGQDVFSQDIKRPLRAIANGEKALWAEILEHCSLGVQTSKELVIKEFSSKIHWCYGSRDEKFKGLKQKFEMLLPKSHIIEVEQSGHGVLFEQPQQLAQEILRIVKNVE